MGADISTPTLKPTMSAAPTVTPVPSAAPTTLPPTSFELAAPTPPTTFYASSFPALSAFCQVDNADITVTGDITFTSQITIRGKTISITSTTGATLTSDRSFAPDSGGMLNIYSATVTLSGLHFVSGSATRGGCIYVDASDLIVNSCSLTECDGVS